MTPTNMLRLWLVAGLLLLGIGGCSTLRPYLDHAAGEPSLVSYAASLTRMDANRRQQALNDARDRWQRTRAPRDRARLALAHAQWDHPGHDPGTAVQELHKVLAADAARLTEAERQFLEFRAAELAHATARHNELNALRQEKATLKKTLQEAERKLRAITDIERDLGRDPSPE